MLLLCTLPANECPEDKYLNRHVVGEIAAACAHHPDTWRDLGIELLGQGGIAELDVIKANNVDNVTKCCSAMLTLWRQRQADAIWSQLIEALKQLKLNRVARDIENRLKSPTELEDKMVGAMQVMKITPTQQQDEPTKYNLQEESCKGMFSHLQRLVPCMHQNTAQTSCIYTCYIIHAVAIFLKHGSAGR